MMLPVEGRVVELVKGGVRVQVLGKLAFCPISQLDTRRVETGEEFVGKKMSFRITQLSEGGRNIIVSRKKLLEEERGATAGSFATEHKAGDVVTGRISRLEKFGAFVEVSPGIDGLAHISELSWSRVNDPAEAVQVGQELPVKILKMEREGDRLRISLSVKQAEGTPWERLPPEIQTGHVMDGKVTRCMKFGAFVELVPGIEGLIPLSEMTYDKRAMRAEDFVKEGEAVSVMVKDVDLGARRISLSLRDAAGVDPWSLVAQKYPVGTIVSGKVERRELYGLFIRLDEGVTGLLPKSKTHDYPEFPYDKLKIGETVAVQVDELRMGERRMSLGVPKDPNSDEWRNYVSTGASKGSEQKSGFGSLGDKLREALDKKKGS
jgi:small subunit ribosomal protein S1